MPEAYKIPCEEYDRLVRRVEAVEKENAELRARVAELETGNFCDVHPATYGFADFSKLLEGATVTVTPAGAGCTSVDPYGIGAQIEAGSPGPDWQK